MHIIWNFSKRYKGAKFLCRFAETQPQTVLNLFLIFHRFQPRCSYKFCSYKKNQCTWESILRRNTIQFHKKNFSSYSLTVWTPKPIFYFSSHKISRFTLFCMLIYKNKVHILMNFVHVVFNEIFAFSKNHRFALRLWTLFEKCNFLSY